MTLSTPAPASRSRLGSIRPPRRLGLRRAGLPALLVLAVSLFGCGGDCRKDVEMGDFELKQRNLPNALLHYEKAARSPDAAKACPEAKAKAEKVKEAMRSGTGSSGLGPTF